MFVIFSEAKKELVLNYLGGLAVNYFHSEGDADLLYGNWICDWGWRESLTPKKNVDFWSKIF